MVTTAAVGRSSFVTALAWVSIVFTGFGTFITLMQTVVVSVLFGSEVPAPSPEQPPLPEWFAFMMRHMWMWFAAVFAVCAGALAASIGLLRRKNWARRAFIGFMALGIAWNVIGAALMLLFFSLPSKIAPPPPQVSGNFELMWTVMLGVNVLLILAFVGLFAWIIKRLVSPAIRAEFTTQ